MTKKNIILIIVCLAFLDGCRTKINIVPTAVDGSRADGTVTLAYEYGLFEDPVVDWDDAQKIAKKRCNAWDYKRAEPFGGVQSICVVRNGYGNCMRQQVKNVYQCLELQEKIRKEE